MPVNEGITAKKITDATNQITTAGKAGLLFGYVLKGGTTAGSSIVFTDGSSGATLWEDYIILQAVAGNAGVRITFDPPLIFGTDIYATLGNTANGATACVAYKEIG